MTVPRHIVQLLKLLLLHCLLLLAGAHAGCTLKTDYVLGWDLLYCDRFSGP